MELNYSCRRLSATSEEKIIFYMDDMSPPTTAQDSSPSSDVGPSVELLEQRQQIAMRSRNNQQKHQQQPRRNSSISSQAGSNNMLPNTGKPRRQRRASEFLDLQQQQQPQCSNNRRSSNCHSASRPRANSCARPTPLGDGRRASVCKAKVSGTRRQSIALQQQQQRRDSTRPARSDGSTRSPSILLSPMSLEVGLVKDPRELERVRRHRRIAMILLGTFLFILAASILAVVVTLTHSSFHRPPTGSKELAEHRANSARKTRSC